MRINMIYRINHSKFRAILFIGIANFWTHWPTGQIHQPKDAAIHARLLKRINPLLILIVSE